MLVGAIGEAAISVDVGIVIGAGGTVIDEEIGEAVACGDSLAAIRSMIVSIAEGAALAAIATAPGATLGDGITGSVAVSVSYVPSGIWAVVSSGSGDWMIVGVDHDNWIAAGTDGDLWIRQ